MFSVLHWLFRPARIDRRHSLDGPSRIDRLHRLKRPTGIYILHSLHRPARIDNLRGRLVSDASCFPLARSSFTFLLFRLARETIWTLFFLAWAGSTTVARLTAILVRVGSVQTFQITAKDWWLAGGGGCSGSDADAFPPARRIRTVLLLLLAHLIAPTCFTLARIWITSIVARGAGVRLYAVWTIWHEIAMD